METSASDQSITSSIGIPIRFSSKPLLSPTSILCCRSCSCYSQCDALLLVLAPSIFRSISSVRWRLHFEFAGPSVARWLVELSGVL